MSATVTLEQLYLRHHHALYRFCLRLTRDAVAADDLMQESFVRLFARLSALPATTDVGAYLQATARNAYLKRLRDSHDQPDRRVDELAGSNDALEWDPERAVLLAEQRGQVRRALGRLTTRHRRVLAMREVEGRSYAEIGLTLGVGSDAVAQVIARARSTLRRELRLEQVDAQQLPVACREMMKPLSAYLDGHLIAAERRDVETHLAECAWCQTTLQAFRDAPRRFRTLGPAGSLASAFGRLAGAARSVLQLPMLGASGAAVTAASVIAVGGAGFWISHALGKPAGRHPAAHRAVGSQPTGGPAAGSGTLLTGASSRVVVGGAAISLALHTTARTGPSGTSGPGGSQPTPTSGGPASTGGTGTPPGTTTVPSTSGTQPLATTPSVSVPRVTVPPHTVGPITTPTVTVPVPTTPTVSVPTVTVPITTPTVTVPVTTPTVTVPVTTPTVTVPVTTPTVTVPVVSTTVTIPPVP